MTQEKLYFKNSREHETGEPNGQRAPAGTKPTNSKLMSYTHFLKSNIWLVFHTEDNVNQRHWNFTAQKKIKRGEKPVRIKRDLEQKWEKGAKTFNGTRGSMTNKTISLTYHSWEAGLRDPTALWTASMQGDGKLQDNQWLTAKRENHKKKKKEKKKKKLG